MPTAITPHELQSPLQIDYSKTTPLLTDDFGVLSKFLDLVQFYLQRNALPINKIEVGGFADPEEDIRQFVIVLRGRFLLEKGAEYLDEMGSAVEDWMRTLPEVEKSFSLAHITFRFQRDRNAPTVRPLGTSSPHNQISDELSQTVAESATIVSRSVFSAYLYEKGATKCRAFVALGISISTHKGKARQNVALSSHLALSSWRFILNDIITCCHAMPPSTD